MSGDTVSIQVGSPQRATFTNVISSAITTIEGMEGVDVPQSLTDFSNWLENTATPRVRQMMSTLSDNGDIFNAYREAFNDQVTEACSDHQRATFINIIGAAVTAINSLPGESAPQSLIHFRNWLENTATPRVRQMMSSLQGLTFDAYRNTFNQVVIEACGWQEFPVPTITGITYSVDETAVRADQIQQGTTVTVTVNGNRLPLAADAAIEILKANSTVEAITAENIQGTEADGVATQLTFTIAIPAGANLGARGIRISPGTTCALDGVDDAECGQVSVLQASAFSIIAAEDDGNGGNGDLPPTCTDEADNDHDAAIDDNDPDCQPGDDGAIAGEADLEGNAQTSYLINNVLGLKARLAFGGSNYVSDTTDINGYQLRSPMASTSPNIAAMLNLRNVLLVGGANNAANLGENPLITTDQDIFRLYGDFESYFQTYLQQQSDDAIDLEGRAALELRPEVRPFGNRHLTIDLTGNVAYGGADRGNPSLMYFNGHELSTIGLLGVGSDFTTNWLRARLFGGYRHSWFDLNRETSGLIELDGQRRGFVAGVEAELDLPRLVDNNGAPRLELSLDYSRGSTYHPQYINGETSHALEDQDIWRAGLTGYWRVEDWSPFAQINFAHLSQSPEGSDTSVSTSWFQLSLGAESPYGSFAAGYGHVNNIALYDQAGDQNGGFIQYALPRSLRGWSGITVRSDLNDFDGRLVGGGMVMYDFMRGIFPASPQPVDGPVPTPSTAPQPFFMQY